MKKLLVVCGPTATGKTKLGIFLAQKFDGEIVSVDSRQVYRCMDIGTGKDLPGNSKFEIRNSKLGKTIGYYLIDEMKVWLYDVVEPDYQFNVADYLECAKKVIEDIWDRGKLPILVGGTGFYLKVLVEGIGTIGVGPDWGLRKKLSNYQIDQLQKSLKKLDAQKFKGLNESDLKNPRRLTRAIEIAIGKPKIKNYNQKLKIDNLLIIGLKAENKILYQRIDKRVDERLKQGMIKEIKNLLKKGFRWENSVLGATIDYRVWQPYFAKKASLKETVQRWKYDIHGYARRQMTWFNKVLQPSTLAKDKEIKTGWFDVAKPNLTRKVERLVKRWYYKS